MRKVLHRPARLPDGERGASAVEFALVLPVLMLLLTGIIDAGYLFGQKLALNQAVREGARNAVVKSTADKNVTSLVQTAAGSSLIDRPGDIAVTDGAGNAPTTCASVKYGNDLTVKASYGTGGLVKFIPGFSDVTLNAEAKFRCEWE